MTSRISRILVLTLFVCLLLAVFPAGPVLAAQPEEAELPEQATEISGKNLITGYSGWKNMTFLFDRNTHDCAESAPAASLTLEHDAGIGSVYIIYQYVYGTYTVTDNTTGAVATVGENRFLHEFIDLEDLFGHAPASITIHYGDESSYIIEMRVFTAGEVPGDIQRWQLPADHKTDLILFSTHGDDDQLYFAGLLPYYAQVRGLQVQVVYLTDHRNATLVRIHEMLNGLWAVGITAYPVFGPFPDFPAVCAYSKTLEQAYTTLGYQGATRDDVVQFCTEQLRRFNPQVVVAHDFKGEYGHGQHMIYADCVAAALEISNDSAQYPDSAASYGLWDVPKAYFHLYKENPIVMDWDTPYAELDGLTPFQVTQKFGFPCHLSQQFTAFPEWLYGEYNWITRAAQITSWSPCQFGLYRTTVGSDSGINDMFENVVSHAELDRLAAEEAARLEAERLAAEEAAQREAEQLAQEEAAQKEAERLAAELVAKAEAERLASARQKQRTVCVLAVCAAGLLIAAVLVFLLIRKKRTVKLS